MKKKIKKSALKRIIKHCIVEIVRDEPEFVAMLVESLNVKNKRDNRNKQMHARAKNIPALLKSNKFDDAQGHMHGNDDLFESLAADTYEHTLPQQLTSERSVPTSRMWEHIISDPMSQDDSPITRLRAAAAASVNSTAVNTLDVARGAQHAMSQRVAHNATMTGQASRIDDNDAYAPSQSQLEAMFADKMRQVNANTDVVKPDAQRRPNVSGVDADLASLGFDVRRWNMHVDESQATKSGARAHASSPELTQIAREYNSEFG